MEVYGYKAFDKGLTNRYGTKFQVGNKYVASGNIKWGNDGNGFHFCENLEDTIRYFDAMNEEIDICYVKGFGKIIEYEDDYYGYYNMYASSNIEIIKLLTREEIISHILNKGYASQERFVMGFKLRDDEIELFLEKNLNLSSYIDYYQKNIKNTFKK